MVYGSKIKLLTCGHSHFSDFTTHWDESPHQFCHDCKSHWFRDRQWTRKEWDAEIEMSWRAEKWQCRDGYRHQVMPLDTQSPPRWGPCRECKYFTPELIGGICNGPELPMGHLIEDDSSCEQWEYRQSAPHSVAGGRKG